jgi:hypothetical protein
MNNLLVFNSMYSSTPPASTNIVFRISYLEPKAPGGHALNRLALRTQTAPALDFEDASFPSWHSAKMGWYHRLNLATGNDFDPLRGPA